MKPNYTNIPSEQNGMAGESAVAYAPQRHAARRNECCKVEDPTLMTREDFYAKLDRAERDIKAGRGVTFTNLEDMHGLIRCKICTESPSLQTQRWTWEN